MATSLVLFDVIKRRPAHQLLDAIHDYYDKELFGVVAFYESKDHVGPIIGGLLASVDNNMAHIEHWWRDPNFQGDDISPALFNGFCERVPPWMMGVEISVDAGYVDACKAMGGLGLKAVGTIKNKDKFEVSGEGIIFQKHFLSTYGR